VVEAAVPQLFLGGNKNTELDVTKCGNFWSAKMLQNTFTAYDPPQISLGELKALSRVQTP